MNDSNITECNFGVDMAPYMYGELSDAASLAFEEHLLECSECTDEFAEISSARYEIYDWKKLEFDPLETPRFEIPYEDGLTVPSWTDRIRTAFGNRWAMPAAAFTGIALLSVFAALYLSLNNSRGEVAANISKSNVASSEIGEQSTRPIIPVPADSKTTASALTEPKFGQAVSRPVVKRAVAKHVDRIEKPVPAVAKPREASASKLQPKMPTLNEAAEDEDTSLRLAELFDDVETRE